MTSAADDLPEWRKSPHDGIPHAFRIADGFGAALCSHSAPASQLGRPMTAEEVTDHHPCKPCTYGLTDLLIAAFVGDNAGHD